MPENKCVFVCVCVCVCVCTCVCFPTVDARVLYVCLERFLRKVALFNNFFISFYLYFLVPKDVAVVVTHLFPLKQRKRDL